MRIVKYSNWGLFVLKLSQSICRVILTLCSVTIVSGLTLAQGLLDGTAAAPAPQPNAVFGDKPTEGGWDGLAQVLATMAPSVDTRIPLTPSDITRRIEGLIRANRLEEALHEVESRNAAELNRQTPGTDVQLMFLHARIMSELKRTNEAEAIYQRMTMRFPELPEPWNNLAVIYAQRGELEQARRAIEMAIMINPKYSFAQSNMGDIEMSLALQAYQRAAETGAPGARAKIRALKNLIEEQNK
jgi:tetratricopeptide (TPR) repeat protein